jgi:ectoine hydroxylase-related dioxygenase (phytanoyl-CoA dioxygenase family)
MTTPRDELATPCALTPEQIDRYQADGFITLAQVLSPATLAWYGERFHRLVEERASREPMERRGTYGKAFQQIMNLWCVDALAHEFVHSRRLAGLAAQLMRVRGVRLYHDQALYKEPGGGFTPWHCDQMYWPMTDPGCCTIWVPFQSVPLEMGPLSFAVGSHRADFGRDLPIGDDSERIIARRITDLPMVEQPFALGDVSLHAGWTFHRAPANRTQQMRAVMTIIYMRDDMRLSAPQRSEQEVDWRTFCTGTAIGEIIASPLNPQLYP